MLRARAPDSREATEEGVLEELVMLKLTLEGEKGVAQG